LSQITSRITNENINIYIASILFLQVSATYSDGFRATAVCPVGGPNAAAKARRVAESILKR
jgi:hypothetical protein